MRVPALADTDGSTQFFNPGYSGKPRLNLVRSVAVLDLTGDEVTAEFYPLG